MKFLDIVDKLQKENKGCIVFIRCGIFFSAVGKDAVLVNRLFNLKPVCMQENMCKCGIPVTSFEKYIPKLNETGYSYVVYDYDKNNGEYKEVGKVYGKMIEENEICLDCKTCNQKNNKKIKSIDSSLKLIGELISENNK